MSYSFSVKAKTKEEAKAHIAHEMDQVVERQPNHSTDRDAVVAAGSAFVDMLGDVPDGQSIHVSMSGSLSWNGTEPANYTGAGVNVSASLRAD